MVKMTDQELVNNIERSRRTARLRLADILKLLGVTRVAYYNWLKGARMRPKNRKRMLFVLRVFIHAFKSGKLPLAPGSKMPRKQREELLLEIARKVKHDNNARVSTPATTK